MFVATGFDEMYKMLIDSASLNFFCVDFFLQEINVRKKKWFIIKINILSVLTWRNHRFFSLISTESFFRRYNKYYCHLFTSLSIIFWLTSLLICDFCTKIVVSRVEKVSWMETTENIFAQIWARRWICTITPSIYYAYTRYSDKTPSSQNCSDLWKILRSDPSKKCYINTYPIVLLL